MTWSRPISTWLAPALILALGVAAILFDGFGIASNLSNRLFDAYQRHAARPAATSQVRILDLPSMDEDSLTGVTRSLAAQGVRLIVLTAPLEPGPSPKSLAVKLPPGSDAAKEALNKLPEPGHDLAQAMSATKAVVPVILGAAGREPNIKAQLHWRGTADPFAPAPRFDAAAGSPPLLETNAAGTAAPTILPDMDGVVRRLPLVFNVRSGLVPGMAAEAVRLLDGQAAISFTSDERDPLTFFRGVGMAAMESKAGAIATDSDGRIRLHFANGLAALSPDSLNDPSLKDAIVVIGAQGAMLKTPFGPMSLSGVTGQGIENLMTGDVLSRPGWLFVVEALLLALFGTAMLLLLRFGLGWAAALVMVALAVMGLGSWYLYAAHNVLADAATPGLALLLAFAAAVLAYLQDLRMAHAGLRMAFQDSLPRATIEKIARRPQLLNIDGETRTVTYLVCGVRGLTQLAATYKDDPAAFTNLMQRTLTPLIDQALAHGGTIDRLTADGFAAFWNAPLDDGEHALHACEAANGMAIMSARVTEHLAQNYHGDAAPPLVEIGVGVATGPVIAGGFGGAGRVGYSVNGDAVTLAQRIQALSHQYGPALVVADRTKALADRGFAFLELDTIAAGAQDPPTTLYAIMGNPVSKASPKFRALTVFHDHIFQAIRKQQWQMARELIAQCRRLSGASQKLYDLHLTRIAWYEQHPPGPDWDGAFRPILE
jgi:adenylate cyclase